jgi:hypothetical protein
MSVISSLNSPIVYGMRLPICSNKAHHTRMNNVTLTLRYNKQAFAMNKGTARANG